MKKHGVAFYDIFVGEYVRLVTSSVSSTEVQNQKESVSQTGPVAIESYLVDMDDTFYYLGAVPTAINQAIRIDNIIHIEIIDPRTMYDDLLENVDLANDPTKMN